MEKIHGSVVLRPTRIAFLVRPTQKNISTVGKIIELCTCLWGGAFNPIIPVCSSLPSAWREKNYKEVTGRGLGDGYLRFFEPDVFVEAEAGLAKELGVQDSNRYLGQRILALKNFIVKPDGWEADFASGLRAFDIYRDMYEREFQFVSRKKRRVAVLARSKSDYFSTAVFGALPTHRDLRYISRGYSDAFDPKSVSLGPAEFLKLAQQDYLTPLNATMHNIEVNFDGRDDPTLFVFDPTKAIDLIDFWNIQQYRRDVFPVNVHWFEELSPFLQRQIKRNYRPLPRNKNGVMIRTTIEIARSIPAAKAEALVRANLKDVPKGSISLKLWHDPIWRTDWRSGVQPRRAKLVSEKKDIEETVSEDDLSLQYQSLSPQFASKYSFANNRSRWVNVVQLGRDYFGSSKIALSFPSNIKNPDFPRLGTAPVISSREGLVIRQQYKTEKSSLTLLDQQRAITKWLSSLGISAQPSNAGRNAEQVLRAVGGPSGCGIFADEGTLKLLDKMAKSIHRELDGTAAVYPDRTATVSEWKQVVGRRKSRTFDNASVSSFIDSNVIRIGLGLKCPHCAKDNWYSVRDVDYEIVCERCVQKYPFPQADIKFGENDWQYRAIGPFSVPDYANGAYATVLTLRLFADTIYSHKPPSTFSTGLDIDLSGQKFEVDFFGWYTEGQKFWVDPSPVVVFGETKSFGAHVFKERDVARLKALAEKIPSSFVVFSTLKPHLGLEEKMRIAKFAEWGRALTSEGQPRALVIVLTGLELFAEWNLKETWKDARGRHAALTSHPSVHIDDLWSLADLTQQLYLDLPSYDDWNRIRWEKKQARASRRR